MKTAGRNSPGGALFLGFFFLAFLIVDTGRSIITALFQSRENAMAVWGFRKAELIEGHIMLAKMNAGFAD